jgi:hypothetical protein
MTCIHIPPNFVVTIMLCLFRNTLLQPSFWSHLKQELHPKAFPNTQLPFLQFTNLISRLKLSTNVLTFRFLSQPHNLQYLKQCWTFTHSTLLSHYNTENVLILIQSPDCGTNILRKQTLRKIFQNDLQELLCLPADTSTLTWLPPALRL